MFNLRRRPLSHARARQLPLSGAHERWRVSGLLNVEARRLNKPMPFNSLTRLRLRSIFTLFAFAKAARESSSQMSAAPGFIDGAILAEGRLVFWTRSSWESEEAMKAFRTAGAHGAVMPKLLDWCDEACVAHWQGDVEKDWDALYARMAQTKRMSKVRKPTKAQQEGRFGRMFRWSPEQPVKPAKR